MGLQNDQQLQQKAFLASGFRSHFGLYCRSKTDSHRKVCSHGEWEHLQIHSIPNILWSTKVCCWSFTVTEPGGTIEWKSICVVWDGREVERGFNLCNLLQHTLLNKSQCLNWKVWTYNHVYCYFIKFIHFGKPGRIYSYNTMTMVWSKAASCDLWNFHNYAMYMCPK